MPDTEPRPSDDRVVATAVPTGARLEPSPRWVRAVFNGVTVADSRRAMLFYEARRLPIYYFPVEDVRMDLLSPTGRRADPIRGEMSLWSLRVGDRESESAAWRHERALAEVPELERYIAFSWNEMDAWYEEDDEVYVHPRDPYHRVDVLHSSRQVRVVVLGETVAESRRPSLLFETGLPTRYYLPRQDVRMDLLVPSSTTTQCPYKGAASYYSVRVGKRLARDMAWTYRYPIPECTKIENLVCFFDERVDAIHVDGEPAPRPQTPWSRPPVIVELE